MQEVWEKVPDDVIAVLAPLDALADDRLERLLDRSQGVRLEVPPDTRVEDIGPTTDRLVHDGLDDDVQDAAAVLSLSAMDEDVAT